MLHLTNLRPFESYSDIIKKLDGGGASFPSGRTSAAFATATYLSLEYLKLYVIVPSYSWASSVGYSRMYLGVHYPSDVLGGMIVGVGIFLPISKQMNQYELL
jgi:undecaprenyl-diphosphatase